MITVTVQVGEPPFDDAEPVTYDLGDVTASQDRARIVRKHRKDNLTEGPGWVEFDTYSAARQVVEEWTRGMRTRMTWGEGS